MPKKEKDPKNKETAASLANDWQKALSECIRATEDFTREHPSYGLFLSFLAGYTISGFFRKK